MNMDCGFGVVKRVSCAYANSDGSGFLAQANLSRLGEISSTRPFCLRELSLRRRAPVLSESTSRSSKKVSPQRGGLASTRVRDNATVPLFEPSPRRKELS